jgi:hypothetical protein
MSFESEKSIFVHFPKTGGSAVHYTADHNGRKLRSPPANDGHKPASWFKVDKPSWCILRDPFDWYISMYRFLVDTEWMRNGDIRGASFEKFVERRQGLYTKFCTELEIAKVNHLYLYKDIQRAYNVHVGPEILETQCVSKSVKPVMGSKLIDVIDKADVVGIAIYRALEVRSKHGLERHTRVV